MQVSRRLTGILGGVVLLSCAGSGWAGLGDFVESITDGVGDAANSVGQAVGLRDVTDGLDGTLLDEVLAKSPDVEDGAAPAQVTEAERLEDIRQVRRSQTTLAEVADLEAYANGVMRKVAAVWPGQVQPVQVRLTSSPDFGAHTLPHGTVFLSLGTVLQLENEDELAAMLGHEYSHLILGHHEKDAIDEFKDKAFDYGELLMRMQGGSGGQATRNYAKLRVAQWAATHALMPKWSRGQEAEADILGIDLLIRAGYNADGMKSMLQKVESTAQRKAEFVAANPINSRSTPGGASLQLDLGTVLDNISGALADELGDEHEDARKRRERVRNYLRDKYPERPRPELGVQAYDGQLHRTATARRLALYEKAHKAGDLMAEAGDGIDAKGLKQAGDLTLAAIKPETRGDASLWMQLYLVRDQQGQAGSAQENLELALATGGAPYGTYVTLAQRAMAQRQYANALDHLDRLEADLGNDEETLDMRIAAVRGLNRAHGDLLARCVATGRSALIERCNTAAGNARSGGATQQPSNPWGAPAAGFSPKNWFQ